MNEDAIKWAAAKFAELRPDNWQGSPGALEYHADKLQGLEANPATDEQAGLIFDAHMSDPISWDFARKIIQMQLKAGISLHPLLARMAALMMSGERPEWDKGRNANYDRNCIAIRIMEGLRDQFGIAPTRNATSSAVSGADIVAEVMNEHKLGVTVEGIIKVWGRRKQYA